jgi:MORN repeat protein
VPKGRIKTAESVINNIFRLFSSLAKAIPEYSQFVKATTNLAKGCPMNHAGAIVTGAILFVAAEAVAQTNNPLPPDWITTANQPCKVWNPEPRPNESVTWSGSCENGYASGKGILRWTENGRPEIEFDGQYKNGKRNGPGVMITPDGDRFEGVWVNDKLLTGDGNAI